MKSASSKQNRINRFATRTQKTLLPLVAVGGSLAGLPASALELGDLTVQSRLGQPLRASIAYALAPYEQLAESCISLGAGVSASGLPGIGRATISVVGGVANGTILLSGKTPVREPMVAAHVAVDCPYTANLSREYMLFIDPAGQAIDEQPVAQTTSAAPAAPARKSTAVTTRRAPAASTASREPIGRSTRYRVQPGDSLSRIAERIENRSIGLWPAVNAIFDMNPDAFMDNDPNKLKAGSWLTIPDFDASADGSEAVVSATAPSTSASAESITKPASPVESVAKTTPPAESTAKIAPPAESIAKTAPPVATSEAISGGTSDLSPGDVILDSDNPFVILDAELEGPTTISSSPNVPTAIIDTSTRESSLSWLMWLAGSGLVMIIGLLLFGRRFRGRYSAPPIAPVADHPMRRATDGDTENIEAIAPENFDLENDSPTEENLALDAELIVGTELEEGTDMDVAQDFSFASTTEVDIELPFEPEPAIASANMDTVEHSILDSEILPNDDEYEFSVIVDATKMPQPEDITQYDLKAIEVSSVGETSMTDSYTINREVDFSILEQDYEDEFTATQALNMEIARAAAELAKTVANNEADDATAGMPLATVTELDITTQLPSRDENISDLDDTGINEAITVNISTEDGTVDMPDADNDDTSEMEIDGGAVDTKAV